MNKGLLQETSKSLVVWGVGCIESKVGKQVELKLCRVLNWMGSG